MTSQLDTPVTLQAFDESPWPAVWAVAGRRILRCLVKHHVVLLPMESAGRRDLRVAQILEGLREVNGSDWWLRSYEFLEEEGGLLARAVECHCVLPDVRTLDALFLAGAWRSGPAWARGWCWLPWPTPMDAARVVYSSETYERALIYIAAPFWPAFRQVTARRTALSACRGQVTSTRAPTMPSSDAGAMPEEEVDPEQIMGWEVLSTEYAEQPPDSVLEEVPDLYLHDYLDLREFQETLTVPWVRRQGMPERSCFL